MTLPRTGRRYRHSLRPGVDLEGNDRPAIDRDVDEHRRLARPAEIRALENGRKYDVS
jgi:hypothetical protein